MTGKNVNQCISIEVIPLKLFTLDETPFNITLSFLTGRKIEAQVSANTTIAELQRLIQDREDITPDQMMLIYDSRLISSRYGPRNECQCIIHIAQMDQSLINDIGQKLGRFGLKAVCSRHGLLSSKYSLTKEQNDNVVIILRLRGGGREKRAPGSFILDRHMLTIAPGGKIRYEAVLPHSLERETRYLWDEENSLTFKAALLDFRTFQKVTGDRTSIPALDEKAYSKLGLPYFKHPSDLRANLLSTPEGLTTYTALDSGRPLKSLGEMLDLDEGSQCIREVKTDSTSATGRSVRISGLDAIYATWKPLGLTNQPPQPPVDWDSSSMKDSESSSLDGDSISQDLTSSSQESLHAHLDDVLDLGLGDSQRMALEEYLNATEDRIGNAVAFLQACRWDAKEAIDCFYGRKPCPDNSSRDQVPVADSSSESSESSGARITPLGPITPPPADSAVSSKRHKRPFRSLLASLRVKLGRR